MISIAPMHRRWLHASLALLVVVAMGHCAWEWQAVLGQAVEAATYRARNQSMPIMPHRGCHNETGCMCRGATQATAVDVTYCEASYSALLPLTANDVSYAIETPARGFFADSLDMPPSLYGRMLRAHLGSLVI